MNSENIGYENGLKALKQVEVFLAQVGWEPQQTDIEEVLLVDFESENIPIANAHFDVRVDYERFLCYFNFKDIAGEEQRKYVMEFITLANFDLVIGNFELNLNTGQVRFKSSVDFTQLELNNTFIRNTIKCAMDVVEVYGEALVEVINGTKEPMRAFQEAGVGLTNSNEKGKFNLE
ncbi:YbjN domain-containing protein [Aquimarina algiphila]|uniref:YbjN domain-containing protein n=1 Tax=Aquimarina algiphila TaxID=2047982 RepID=UPI00233103E9|nr:YbjN domain-containing protein [Aquimarina algiphila]